MCPHEVEVKAVLLMDPDREKGKRAISLTLASLLAQGARAIGAREQTDIYLSHPCKDLASTDESIRVRSERSLPPHGDGAWRTLLTYKGPKVSALTKARYERELVLAQGAGPVEAEDLFTRLGFTRAMVVQKERTSLELDGVDVSLDLVEGLGAFIELELMSEGMAEAEPKVLGLLSRLGLTRTERRSYLELLLEKGLNR
jgi:adenylate cyclase class 2